jgi:bromodomain-containing factor 1
MGELIRPPRLFFLRLPSIYMSAHRLPSIISTHSRASPDFHTSITDFHNFSVNDATDTQMHDNDNTSAPQNHEAFDENHTLPSTTKIDTTESPALEVNPGGPTPTDDTSSGIAPVAGYIPKDAPNLSHPTPPPDQPLTSGEANVDTEMHDQDQDQDQPIEQDSKPESVSEQLVSAESTQPQDEPILADSKPEESLLNGVSKSTEPPLDADVETSVDAKPEPAPIESTRESAQSGLVRSREDDEDDEPVAKRAKMESPPPAQDSLSSAEVPAPTPAIDETKPDAKPEFKPEVQPELKPELKPEVPAAAAAATESTQPAQASIPSVQTPAATIEKPTVSAQAPDSRRKEAKYSTAQMTNPQKSFLLEKLKNTKKTKHAMFFISPVDPVALNIPTYPDVIKHPMDLGTMENKLKNDRYSSVQAFADDLQLIVDNAEKFNGPQHAVTHAGNNMLAYTNNFMAKVPGPGQAFTQKVKKFSPAPPKQPAVRRDARPAQAPAPALPAKERSHASEAFALQSDGTPQIRRDSQIQRPARAIKPPNREVTYPKPKRREHLLELRFCEYALDLIRGPKYARVNHVFLLPVDPVALNIPHYRQIVKNPMDLGTMTQKLKQGQYGKASEVRKDFDLMIENCLLFNPVGNPVRDLGIELKREFDQIWRDKEKWERANKPKVERASSVSGDESAADESEEDEDEPQDEAQATIRALSQKLAEMQNQLAGLGQGKAPKSKKSKDVSKSSKKKSLPATISKVSKVVHPAPKSKPKKQKPVTYEEKQEISSAVEKMDGAQIERLTQIITENCEKYRNMGDEMELEIDDLPDDVQRLLLKHVRGIFGNPNRGSSIRAPSPDDLAAADDDDFEPSHRSRGGSGGGDPKRKKHKPMGKKEQQDSINILRNQLAAFNGGRPSGSVSPATANHAAAGRGGDDESSSDEESEEE